jgi:uncharacterized protein YjbI with pentapeptide repeats
VYGVLAFDREQNNREQERISRAWSLVADSKAQDQGNLGLNEALQALNRRNIDLGRIQLKRTYLSKVNLPRAILDHADLEGARLEQANLCGAQLSQAKLKEANLRATDLRGAKLEGANLIGANLRGVDFSPLAANAGEDSGPILTNLRGANLENADLSGANLSGADLRAARLGGATLFRADLRGAHLEFAHLRKAKLDAADLDRANLRAAILSGATLRGARLTGTTLTAAQFDDVDATRADFLGARDVPIDVDRTVACFDQFSETRSLCGPPQPTAITGAPVGIDLLAKGLESFEIEQPLYAQVYGLALGLQSVMDRKKGLPGLKDGSCKILGVAGTIESNGRVLTLEGRPLLPQHLRDDKHRAMLGLWGDLARPTMSANEIGALGCEGR